MVHSSRVEVAYLVISTQEDNGFLSTVYLIGKTVYHAYGMLAVARFGQTVAVEYHKVVVDALAKALQVGKSFAVLVQVVEDEAREVLVLEGRSAERVERSAQRVGTEVVGVGSLVQYFHCTHAIIVACAGLQVVKPDVVLYVIAHLLSVEYGTCALCMLRVGTVFYPAMAHAVGLEHHIY